MRTLRIQTSAKSNSSIILSGLCPQDIERVALQPPCVMRLSAMMCSDKQPRIEEPEGGVVAVTDETTLAGFLWATQNTETKDHTGLGRPKTQMKLVGYNGPVFGSTNSDPCA